jgi:hypothetical protein
MIAPTNISMQEVTTIAKMAAIIHASKISVINSFHDNVEHCDCHNEAFTLFEQVVERVRVAEEIRSKES